MRHYHHKPRRGDAVWVEGRRPQPNGKIINVSFSSETVTVVFHDRGGTGEVDLDRFWGNQRKGVWYIEAEEFEDAFHEEQLGWVHMMWDDHLKDESLTLAERLPRLIFLSYYFPCYGDRCKDASNKRREMLAALIGRHGRDVDWQQVHRLSDICRVGTSISASLNPDKKIYSI